MVKMRKEKKRIRKGNKGDLEKKKKYKDESS